MARIAFGVMNGNYRNPKRFHPIIHGIRKASQSDMPDSLITDGMKFRIQNDPVHGRLYFGQKIFTQSLLLIFVPAVGIVDFLADTGLEDQWHIHRGLLT